MSLKILKDGIVIAEAVDERTNFIPTYETEKTKDPSIFILTEADRDRNEGLTPRDF
jgi:hypothetical protein